MCVVSNVSDNWRRNRFPDFWPVPQPYRPDVDVHKVLDSVEVARLKKEIERLKAELEKARREDIEDNNPDCQMEDKVAVIKALAKALGVDLGNVFEGHK